MMFESQDIDFYESANIQQVQQEQNEFNEKFEMIEFEKISNMDQISSFKDEIQCPVCYNILIDPLSCNNCEKSICTKCYNLGVKCQKKNQCPCCRSNSQLLPAKRILVSLLNKVKLFCNNKDQGCTSIVAYEQREKHKEECQYIRVKCHNQRCQEIIFRKDIHQHLTICPYEQVTCKLCQMRVLQIKLEEHEVQTCIVREVSCPDCNQKMILPLFQSHKDDYCSSKYQTCELCKIKYTVEEFQNHTTVKCIAEQRKQYREKLEKERLKNIEDKPSEIRAFPYEQQEQFPAFQGKNVRLICIFLSTIIAVEPMFQYYYDNY